MASREEIEDNIPIIGEDLPNVITYSKALPFSLTNVNRHSYAYSRVSRPEDLAVPYSSIKVTKEAREQGVREILVWAGERADKYPHIRATLDLWGFYSYVEYIYTVCELAFLEGLVPVLELGFLTPDEMKKLSEVVAVFKIMIDSVDLDAQAEVYKHSPSKRFDFRMKLLTWASKLKVPIATGIVVGTGETPDHRREALQAIADLHEKHGFIHEVLIQNFVPVPGGPFADQPAPSHQEMLDTVEMALKIFGEDVHVVVPLELNPKIEDFISMGVRDLGRITYSPQPTLSKKNKVDLDDVSARLNDLGFELQQRFPIRMSYINDGFYSKKLGQVFDPIKYKIRKEGLEKAQKARSASSGA